MAQPIELNQGESAFLALGPYDDVVVTNATVITAAGPVAVTGATKFGPTPGGMMLRLVGGTGCTYAIRSEIQSLAQVPGIGALLGVYIGPWSGRPNPTLHQGARAFITDVGLDGCWVKSTGNRWRTDGPVVMPGMVGGTYVKSDSDPDWGVGWNCTLPTGFMGPTGRIVIEPVWTFPASTSRKELQVIVNASLPIYAKTRTSTTGEAPLVELLNRGTTTNQVAAYNGTPSYGSGGAVIVATGTFNTDASEVSILARARFPDAGDTGTETITLHKVSATFYPG